MENLFLIGFMGSGKSTIAAALQKRYKMQLVEMDQMIVERANMSISDIFEKYGESHFRDLETALVQEIQNISNQVVSCGGGVVLREQNVVEMKKSGKIVMLDAKPETILKRVERDDNRPILKGNKNIAFITELMEKRRDKYEAAADIQIQTDGKSVEEICREIIDNVKGIK